MLANKMFDTIPGNMRKTVEAFVPKDLLQYFHFGEDEIKIDMTANKTVMYANSGELLKMLHQFRCFPGGFSLFSSEIAEPMTTYLYVYESTKKNRYLFKQSLLSHLITAVPQAGNHEDLLILSIIGHWQKVREAQLGSQFELVPYHKELLDKLKVKLHLIQIPTAVRIMKKKEVFEELKKFLPVHENDPEFASVMKALTKYEKNSNRKFRTNFWLILLLKKVIEEFDRFLEAYPKSDEKIPVVRLFQNGKHEFLFAHELLDKMRKAQMDVSGIEERIENMDEMQTIGLDELGLPKEQLEKIEFAVTPIQKTKHRSFYIPSFNGKFCILATDFLLEVMRETVTVKSIFQCVTKENAKIALELFKELEEMVIEASKNSCFIDITDAEKIRNSFFARFEHCFGDAPKKARTIRKVGPKGFTLEYLKNEVRYLGLSEIFQNVLRLVDLSWEALTSSKKPKDLRTHDIYEVLENLQLTCAIRLTPSISKFFHAQKVCGNIFQTCAYCKGTFPLEPKSSESEEKLEENLPVTKEQPEGVDQVSSDETASEDVTTSSESNSDEVEKISKKQEKRKRQAEKKKSARAESQSTENNDASSSDSESKVCEKCFRTSQKCMEANEKFRQEKIKNKALKKELKTVSTELEFIKKREVEKDEEIRILREQLAASEEIVAEFQNQEEPESVRIYQAPEVMPVPEASESRPDMMEVLIKLLDIKDTLPEHKKEATELAEELLSKTTQKKYHDLVESEMIKFRSDYSVYYQSVEEHITWIRKNPKERLDLLRLLPHYPELSKDFHKAYDNVVNKKELDDQECLICMESMEEETGTRLSCSWRRQQPGRTLTRRPAIISGRVDDKMKEISNDGTAVARRRELSVNYIDTRNCLKYRFQENILFIIDNMSIAKALR